MRCALLFACAILFALAAPAADVLYPHDNPLWTPVADDVYLQEVGSRVESDAALTSLAVLGERVYAVRDGAIVLLDGAAFSPVTGAPASVARIMSLDNAIWAMTTGGLYRSTGASWDLVDSQEFVDLCLHRGVVHGTTKSDVYRFEEGKFISLKPANGYMSSDVTVMMADGTQRLPEPVNLGPVHAIASYADTLYFLRRGELILFDGNMVDARTLDYGIFPSPVLRDLLSVGSTLYVGTERGLSTLRGMTLTTVDGSQGLPYEDITSLTTGFGGDIWIGTTRGAIRKTDDDFHYFGAQNWLPGDYVYDIAVKGQTVYVATDKGLGIINYEPYTLAKKAAFYEQEMDNWGMKRLGFVHKVYWNESTKSWIREISDNDGGHTAPYLVAMSMKYAATGDESARQAALDSFQAMIWMEEITGVPGFMARAIWSTTGDEDERATQGSGGLPAKWYATDDGKWYWKGDTSSDEVNAHVYAVAVFHDLVAQGPEKKRAADHLARIATHIIVNGWLLRDKDGEPTRWGRWDPDYLLKPYGFVARGLNGMEVMTYVRSAYAVTGDQQYEDGFKALLNLGYHRYTVRQRLVFPPEDIAPWDDNLAFMCYYTLLRYTNDPELRSIFLRSLERSYEFKRPEHVAWYNFVYGAITGNDCEADLAAQYLRDFPMDLRGMPYKNSHRSDVKLLMSREPYVAGIKALSPRETQAKNGARWVMPLDGGSGKQVSAPADWLQDYWIGRYHGIILAPSTNDPSLTTVKPLSGPPIGAKPFPGPARPEGLIPAQ